MATNKKITELTELEEADLADDDVLPIVDISAGQTRKVRKSTLASALSGVASIAATTPVAVDQATGAVTVSLDTVPIASGGTGATTAAEAITNLGATSDPTDTRGDIITRGASALQKLGIGASGYVLKSDGTDPTWSQVAASELTGNVDLTTQVTGTLPLANGGTNATTASGARTSLGLSSMSVQDAGGVAITGGTITGITDLAVADGGTGASDAATARTNLGAAASGANTDITSLAADIVISGSTSGDALRITQTGAGNALVVEDSTNPDSTPFVVDASGDVGIGTTSPSYPLQVSSSSGAGAQVGLTYVPSSVTMLLRAGGSDVNVGSVGSHPLVFKTNDTERLRILSSGGLTFNGDTAAANALDDYEEGTFTLTLNGATTTTYTTNSGAYTKVGDIVYVRGILHINSYGDGNGGQIDGFPFASSGESALSIAKISSIQTAVVDISFRIVGSSGYFMHRTAASTTETTNPSQMAASGAYLSFAGTYKAS